MDLQLMSNGEILHADPFKELLASCKEFQDFVDAHKDTVGFESPDRLDSQKKKENLCERLAKHKA